MVDFSDRRDIKRWLNAINPAKRRREVVVAMAARASLRVTPRLRLSLGKSRSRATVLSNWVLPSLRATALAWATAKYPARGSELRGYADAAAYAAGVAASAADEAYPYAPDVYTAIDASNAANAAAASAAHPAAAARADDAAASAAAYAIAHATDACDADTAFVAACASDVALIDGGGSSSELMEFPLWPNRAPDWATEAWTDLRAALLAAAEGWEVWTNWYDARLAGDADHSPNEALEIARATIPDEIWKQSPAVVNAEIKRLIAEHKGGAPVDVEEPPQPEPSLQQRPAAFQFRVVDDKIDASPEDARPIDAQGARDLYDEAKRKARHLEHRLQRAQADVDLRAHVDLLLTRLGESYPEMRPGLMLSVLRSLESDVRAYDSEEGRKELSAALLSSILDLAESVRDLCAMFPRSREIEAEAVSLGLPLQRMPEILWTIDEVVAKVSHSDGVTEDGREAINASAADLAHQRGLADEAKQSAYFLVDFANFTRAGLKHLKTAGAVFGRELGGFSADNWRAVRRGAPKGIERGAAQVSRGLIVGGVGVLMHVLGSDITALASMVAAYAPLHEILESMSGPPPETPAPNAPPVDAEAAAPRAPAPRKRTTRRSPAKPPTRKRTRP
jgi:hypothetical protein